MKFADGNDFDSWDIQTFLKMSEDLVCKINLVGRIERMNECGFALLGYDREAVIDSLWGLVYTDDVPILTNALSEVGAGKIKRDVYLRCLHKDNSVRYFSWSFFKNSNAGTILCLARDLTERQTQAWLLEQTQSMARMGGWEYEVDAARLSWTRGMYSLFSVSPDDYAPTLTSALSFYSDESAKLMSRAVCQALSVGTSFELELKVSDESAGHRWIKTFCKARLEQGRVISLLGTCQDISAEKKISEEKEKSDRLLQKILNSVPALISYMDRDFKYLFMNAAYERWFGDATPEIREDRLENVFGKEAAILIRTHRERAIASQQFTRFELHFTSPGENSRWIEFQYHPHINKEQNVEGLIVLCLDLTESKKADLEIRKNESKLKRVLQDGRTGLWEADLLEQSISWSENIFRWLGRERVLKMEIARFREMLHPEDRHLLEFHFTLPSESAEIHFRIRHQNGNYLWFFNTVNPVFDSSGQLTHLAGLSIDVTEQRSLRDTVESQKIKMLASSRLSELGQMASGIAHEINNPLAIIHAKAGLLKDQAEEGAVESSEVVASTQLIEQTAWRISKIIRSLRQLSRDGGSDPFERISLKKAFDDALELCRQRFKSEKIELVLDPQIDSIFIEARAVQISQVILNLVTNAQDAVEGQANKWVRITAREFDHDILLIFEDSGPGIAEDVKDHVFQPFFTTKNPGKGTGLGLSICQSIVQSHSGTIEIGYEGERSHFRISMPKVQKPKASLKVAA